MTPDPKELPRAKARYGYNRIVVDDCPYCHRVHYHNFPLESRQRMADCLQGEYILDFTDELPTC